MQNLSLDKKPLVMVTGGTGMLGLNLQDVIRELLAQDPIELI